MSKSFQQIKDELSKKNVELVAVSKTKSDEDILRIYQQGQRLFGENYAKELQGKATRLPKDIQWHFIGHLQRKQVKYIIDSVALIQSVDRVDLLQEINKRAGKIDRVIPVLLQLHIAQEEHKNGFSEQDLIEFLNSNTFKDLKHIEYHGMMGMATFTNDEEQLIKEFDYCHQQFQKIKATYFQDNAHFNYLSMGMSGDYELAIAHGANMVRIGSLIFGKR